MVSSAYLKQLCKTLKKECNEVKNAKGYLEVNGKLIEIDFNELFWIYWKVQVYETEHSI